jgi:hypothetical protein
VKVRKVKPAVSSRKKKQRVRVSKKISNRASVRVNITAPASGGFSGGGGASSSSSSAAPASAPSLPMSSYGGVMDTFGPDKLLEVIEKVRAIGERSFVGTMQQRPNEVQERFIQVPGPPGRDGRDGIDGRDGLSIRGEPGLAGRDGVSIRGEQGPAGRDGVSIRGEQGPAGRDGVSIRGEQGPAGRDGLRGEIGPQGASIAIQGPRGEPGRDGDAAMVDVESVGRVQAIEDQLLRIQGAPAQVPLQLTQNFQAPQIDARSLTMAPGVMQGIQQQQRDVMYNPLNTPRLRYENRPQLGAPPITTMVPAAGRNIVRFGDREVPVGQGAIVPAAGRSMVRFGNAEVPVGQGAIVPALGRELVAMDDQ